MLSTIDSFAMPAASVPATSFSSPLTPPSAASSSSSSSGAASFAAFPALSPPSSCSSSFPLPAAAALAALQGLTGSIISSFGLGRLSLKPNMLSTYS